MSIQTVRCMHLLHHMDASRQKLVKFAANDCAWTCIHLNLRAEYNWIYNNNDNNNNGDLYCVLTKISTTQGLCQYDLVKFAISECVV